jgi:uncharacterized protein YpuA (DUF1002 family)
MKLNGVIKQLGMLAMILIMLFGTNAGNAFARTGEEQSVVVYGEQLSQIQKEEVRRLLKVDDPTAVKEVTVTGEDLVTYIKGKPGANMYSSAKITRKDDGSGIEVNMITPENITEVSSEMYENALLTAGVKDAVVDIASPVKVTGHSALVGIYKAYDQSNGTTLNKDRTEVANEELNLATKIAKDEGIDPDKVSQLLTEIKQEIAAQNPATKEDIEKIIDDKLKSLKISLSPEDRQLLIDLFDKMRHLNINFDNVKSQLENLSKDITKRIEETVGDKGFLQKVADFFKELIDSIKSLFS